MNGLRIGIDTGGTFTDLVALFPDGLRHLKVPSTPDDPSRAVLEALERVLDGQELADEDRVAHGTTVATNALLTGQVAASALVTTEGFEDVLEIGRQDRPALYDLEVERVPALVGRERRIGLTERVGPEGNVETPFQRQGEAATQLIERLRALVPPPEAVAVCLLHAYAQPAHEEEVAALLAEHFPEVPVTLSSRLIPVFREYERTSTVVVNAAVQPVMGRYIDRLDRGTGGGRLVVTSSSGGTLSAHRAVQEPVHTLLSGPAAGVAGALAVSRRNGHERILTFDMGGTSTDVALCDGAIRQTAEGIVAGRPVQVAQVDLHTVGAGGGSLARVDRGGALVVGPESAGAVPGPLSYGISDPGPAGEGVTVTDANLLLGRLPSDGLLGGGMPLDEGASRVGLERLAAAAGLTGAASGDAAMRAAEGVVEVAITAMAGALRRISVERGRDPRDHVLVAFGGAGAMHAAALAKAMGMKQVLIPREPGLLSAVGTLVAGLRVDRVRTVLGLHEAGDLAALLPVWHGLEEGSLQHRADLRYEGQSFELTVESGGPQEPWDRLVDRFAEAHQERYGYQRAGSGVELVSVRVEGHGPAAAGLDDLLPPLPPLPPLDGSSPLSGLNGPAGAGDQGWVARPMVWEGESHPTPQIPRDDLPAGTDLRGPALIHEFSATTVVPPDARVDVGHWGDLLITLT